MENIFSSKSYSIMKKNEISKNALKANELLDTFKKNLKSLQEKQNLYRISNHFHEDNEVLKAINCLNEWGDKFFQDSDLNDGIKLASEAVKAMEKYIEELEPYMAFTLIDIIFSSENIPRINGLDYTSIRPERFLAKAVPHTTPTKFMSENFKLYKLLKIWELNEAGKHVFIIQTIYDEYFILQL